MRVMVMMKGDRKPERQPPTEMFELMGNFNEELAEAGVLIGGEGLAWSGRGRKVQLTPEGMRVIDGPFAESKELIAGFWMFNVESLDEAVEWIRRSPLQASGQEIEIREIHESTDFDSFTPELQEQDRRVRERAARNAREALPLATR